jgi:hypothetical protein
MPLVYVFAASKMEAQPVLVLAAQNGAAGQGSTGVIIEHGDGRFAVIITGMGTRNAEAKADGALGLAAPGADGGPPLAGKPDAVLVIGLCGGLTRACGNSASSSTRSVFPPALTRLRRSNARPPSQTVS